MPELMHDIALHSIDQKTNPEHDKIPEKPFTYATEKYEEPKYKVSHKKRQP